jgi:hypothetical protein
MPDLQEDAAVSQAREARETEQVSRSRLWKTEVTCGAANSLEGDLSDYGVL